MFLYIKALLLINTFLFIIAVLFIKAENWDQLKCPKCDWFNKMVQPYNDILWNYLKCEHFNKEKCLHCKYFNHNQNLI